MEKFPHTSAYRNKDPEALLLSAVLNWFTGPLSEDSPSVMDFIRYVSDVVMDNCRKDGLIQKIGSSVGKVKLSDGVFLQTVEINGASTARKKNFVSPGDIPCRPFNLMVLGFLERTVSAGLSAPGAAGLHG